ncbi:25574_t:CDS:1, partial [Gigaspora margarita]
KNRKLYMIYIAKKHARFCAQLAITMDDFKVIPCTLRVLYDGDEIYLLELTFENRLYLKITYVEK